MRLVKPILVETVTENATADGSIEPAFVVRHRLFGKITQIKSSDGTKSRSVWLWKTKQVADISTKDTVNIDGSRFSILSVEESDDPNSKFLNLEIGQATV